MADKRQVLEFAKRVLGDRDPEELRVLAHAAAAKISGEESVLEAAVGEVELPNEHRMDAQPDPDDLRNGADVLEDLPNLDAGDLTDEQQVGLEAIILLFGRPALIVKNDDYGSAGDQWAPKLDPKRAAISEVLRRVGRVELRGHPTFPWVGTAFLVAPDVIMTNRHVAVTFVREKSGTYTFLRGVTARLDYKEEFGIDASDEVGIAECIGIHDEYDLALLRLEQPSAKSPLPVAAVKPETTKNFDVVVCGYPAFDTRNDPQEMVRIFNNVFDVKRLQPGQLTGMTKLNDLEVVGHDASTLGGNSGSAVVDFNSGKVVGLHFGGRYLEGNNAVPLWTLAEDPLLKKAGVNFV